MKGKDDSKVYWQLIAPVRPGQEDAFDQLSDQLSGLQQLESSGQSLTREQLAQSENLISGMQRCLLSPCEAVSAPRVRDAPGWQHEVIDDFAYEQSNLDVDEYLRQRGEEPDCSRCPYGTPYSAPPMLPCEFSAGRLKQLLADDQLREQALTEMEPDRMRSFADDLDVALDHCKSGNPDDAHGLDYLRKAILFLRFWAERGFAVAPCQPHAEERLTVRALWTDGDDLPASQPRAIH